MLLFLISVETQRIDDDLMQTLSSARVWYRLSRSCSQSECRHSLAPTLFRPYLILNERLTPQELTAVLTDGAVDAGR